MLKQTKTDLEKYTLEHPEDSQAKAFLKEFKNINVSYYNDDSDIAQGHFYNKKGKNDIYLNYFNYDKNAQMEFNKTFFHELGHSVESHKDNIVSKREERDVEDAAIVMTQKLYGNSYFNFKNSSKEKYLNYFISADEYKDKPNYSPGHGQ